jgi:hypothetical protein
MVYKLLVISKNINEIQEAVAKLSGDVVTHNIPKTVDVPRASEITVGIPVVVAPQAPQGIVAATNSPVPAGVTVDVTGTPWNPEMHSSSKKMNADGSWKKKKNFTGAETAAPVASAPQAVQAAPLVAPPAPTVQVAVPQFAPQVAQPAPQPQVQAVAQPTYQNIPTIPQSNERPALDYQSFKNDLPMTMTRLISSGQVKQDYVDQLNKYFGIQQIYNVLGDERKCMELFDVLCKQGFITKIGDYPPSVAHTATGQQFVNAMNGVQ